ncbi:TetR/AcrR family transcriptional regulator [Pseudonocardiaceae bacterium YIM PH 21723]|nr:TetR/AcrR family transcriptional regulator [Pseudonocardiaceae bacterium YIM PH 21723]
MATTRERAGYHHGDLANALVDAAVELAKTGGPSAVVLREAARRVGVSATSAYRHFANHQDLLAAVKARAQVDLADAMRAEQAAGDDALSRLHGLGRGYLRFALTQPGWFRAAFNTEVPTDKTSEPFQLLCAALDELVAAGMMSADRRHGAETPLWATVHGLANLITDGPLASLPEAERKRVIDETQSFLTRALT